jgi:hypothetical protein
MSTARDFLAAVQQRAKSSGTLSELGERLVELEETTDRLAEALTAVLGLADEYERDDREHLDRFGQHHPVAYHPYPRIRAAITGALTPKEDDS